MKKAIFFLLFLPLIFGACQKENTLFELPETADVAGERAPDCTAKIRVAGFTNRNSSGVITLRHYEAGFLMSEQVLEFKPPLCNTCTIDIPVTYATRLELTGQTFIGTDPYPTGRILMGLKRPATTKEKPMALKGDGTMLVLEGFTCTDL